MPIDKRKLETALLKKGFEKDITDHNNFRLKAGDKYTGIWTKTSLGSNSEIDERLMSKMKLQLKLDKQTFLDLYNCPLTKEAYIKRLQDKGILPA